MNLFNPYYLKYFFTYPAPFSNNMCQTSNAFGTFCTVATCKWATACSQSFCNLLQELRLFPTFKT